ncbi:histidine kinase [Allosalinactinospora lopnorensis]|uniref:histidine kinase n=1 Tax=Allosalinactinospora lopnorensis TaxID=1352348 RepID=UPI0009E57BD9|nr:histidine kinase [Allosalinactinospora lopnorensis]
MDVLLWLVAVAPLWLADDPLPEHAWITLPVLRVIAAVLLAVATVVSRRWPLAAAALPLAFGMAVAGQVYVAQLALAVIVFAFLLGRRTVGRAAGIRLAALLAVASAALVAASGASSGEDWFTAASTLLLMVVIPWAVGQYLRQQAELAASGFELAARLEREHARAAGRERLRERARIAADMHDALGHELSLLAVQASALQVAADVDPEVRRAAAELRASAAGAGCAAVCSGPSGRPLSWEPCWCWCSSSWAERSEGEAWMDGPTCWGRLRHFPLRGVEENAPFGEVDVLKEHRIRQNRQRRSRGGHRPAARSQHDRDDRSGLPQGASPGAHAGHRRPWSALRERRRRGLIGPLRLPSWLPRPRPSGTGGAFLCLDLRLSGRTRDRTSCPGNSG